MQKIKTLFTAIFFFSFLNILSAQQNDCGNNAGFETGTSAGWVCKYGVYGAGVWSGYCPPYTGGYCPAYPTNYTGTGALNANGINALGTTGNDRHTIMTMNYRPWGGPGVTGMDSISGDSVPVVPPGGGTYSFRIGDEVAGGVGTNPNRLARAEAVRLTFNVNPNNAGFTYQYAMFVQDPGHFADEAPRFEAVVMLPDSNDKIIPCGNYLRIGSSYNPYCSGTEAGSGLRHGLNSWYYSDWVTIGLDLSGYIGQNVAVEFRTSDCFPGATLLYSQAGITTTCTNVLDSVNGGFMGVCCWGSPQSCTTVSNCGGGDAVHTPGTHSAYAYVDAYCSPIYITPFPVCTGDDSVQVCAPWGYKDWVWQTGKPGDTTECIWIHNAMPGDTIVVDINSYAGCPTKSILRLTGTSILAYDTAFCQGDTGTFPLTATLSVPGNYSYSWSGPGVTSTQLTAIAPIPTATSTYMLTVSDTLYGCVYVKKVTVIIMPQPCTVGLNEKKEKDFFRIYPNPSAGQVMITFGEALRNATVRIYESTGREVYSEVFDGKQVMINRKLQAGIYYVELRDGEKQSIQKIVIEE